MERDGVRKESDVPLRSITSRGDHILFLRTKLRGIMPEISETKLKHKARMKYARRLRTPREASSPSPFPARRWLRAGPGIPVRRYCASNMNRAMLRAQRKHVRGRNSKVRLLRAGPCPDNIHNQDTGERKSEGRGIIGVD